MPHWAALTNHICMAAVTMLIMEYTCQNSAISRLLNTADSFSHLVNLNERSGRFFYLAL
jgi:hypothetical protein